MPGNVLNSAASQGNTDAQNALTQARTLVDVEAVETKVSSIDPSEISQEIEAKEDEIAYKKYEKEQGI